MKRIGTIVLTAICFMGIQLAMAGETSPPTEQSHVLPVLVAVNADGKVVRIDPAIHLRDRQMKELEKAVHTMITRPAMKDGHGIYSQFVLQLAVSQDKTGAGGTTFSYVSSQPAPPGPVHWVRRRGGSKNGEFALVNPATQQNDGQNMPAPPPVTPPSMPGK
ncbi:MAG: hypothetical protein WBW92_09990 [Rhodanobacteraceae bacterium]